VADEYNDSITAATTALTAHEFTDGTHPNFTRGAVWRRDRDGGYDMVNLTYRTGFVLATLEMNGAELAVVLKALDDVRKGGGE
jgi:hypothetical protein